MNKILASIITYNPDLSRLDKNIRSIIHQVDKIILIDNGSKNNDKIRQLVSYIISETNLDNIEIINNIENMGIAYTLNQGLGYAKENDYKWLLTLDQDSICDSDMVSKMIKFYNGCPKNKNISIISPNIIDENKKCEIESMKDEIEYPTVVITSGSLTNVEKALTVGGFLEKLFIDYVDHEFCLRLRFNGYEIIKIKQAKLYHELGDIKTYYILGKKATTTNHSALRRYYYYRNSIYVHKKYKDEYPEWTKTDFKREIKAFIGIVLFESDKISKIKYIYQGLKDGKKGCYGKYDKK